MSSLIPVEADFIERKSAAWLHVKALQRKGRRRDRNWANKRPSHNSRGSTSSWAVTFRIKHQRTLTMYGQNMEGVFFRSDISSETHALLGCVL